MKALLKKLLRRLVRSDDGVAAVEFALIVPIMLLAYIGAVEASMVITVDRRVQSASGTLGDLVAREDGAISAALLTDYFRAARGIMNPYPADPLQQVVTLVEVRQNETTRIVWSRQYKNGAYSVGTQHKAGDPFPSLPKAMIDIAKGNYVVVSEGSYAYPPLYGFAFNSTIDLYRENFFMPRFGGGITIN